MKWSLLRFLMPHASHCSCDKTQLFDKAEAKAELVSSVPCAGLVAPIHFQFNPDGLHAESLPGFRAGREEVKSANSLAGSKSASISASIICSLSCPGVCVERECCSLVLVASGQDKNDSWGSRVNLLHHENFL